MAISAVLVANIYTGFTATAWTWWIFFAVFVGIIVQWVFTVRYNEPFIHNGCLTYMINGHRLFILLYPLVMQWRPFMATTTMFFDRPISGLVFLSLCRFRWHLASFIKLGNLVTTPEISKRSNSYKRCTPIKTYPPFRVKDQNMVPYLPNQEPHQGHPAMATLGQAAFTHIDDDSAVGHLSTYDQVVGRIWRQVSQLLTTGLILPRRNMGWRWHAFRQICRSEGWRRKRLPEQLVESKGCLIKGKMWFLVCLRERLWKGRIAIEVEGFFETAACVNICIILLYNIIICIE